MNTEDRILDYIIFGLFRDQEFHTINEVSKKEFYIDILDEALASDIELVDYIEEKIRKDIRNENDLRGSIEKMVSEKDFEPEKETTIRVMRECIGRISAKFLELRNNGWIDLNGEDLKIDSVETKIEEKSKYKNMIIPAGKVLTFILRIEAKKINWGKFIEHISQQYEIRKVKLDDVYSSNKQESLMFEQIKERRKDLDKDENLIFQLDCGPFGRIQPLKTLEGLERCGYIKINGFKIYDPNPSIRKVDTIPEVPEYFGLKANISITNKFKKKIEKDNNEIAEFLGVNRIKKSLTKPNIGFQLTPDSLKYNGKELKITKPQDTRYYFLLKVLLGNPKKIWEYDEIWEKLNGDENYDPKNWKKIYNPAYDINEKIAKETTISDFLEIAKTTIRINPTYLK
jgi:hypothetical protein